MKPDESIKDILVAAIRRHSTDIETWAFTRLWDDADPAVAFELTHACPMGDGELPILYSGIDAGTWTLITTRRVLFADDGRSGSISPSDITPI